MLINFCNYSARYLLNLKIYALKVLFSFKKKCLGTYFDKDLIIPSLLIEIQKQAKIILAYESSYKLKDEIIKVKDELIAVYKQSDAIQKSLIEHLTNN